MALLSYTSPQSPYLNNSFSEFCSNDLYKVGDAKPEMLKSCGASEEQGL